MQLRTALFRLAQFPLVLAIIYLITFFMTWLVPGNPFEKTDRKISPTVKAAMEARFHVGNPAAFMAYYPLRAMQGDFGASLANDFTVNEIISVSLPISVTLGLFALVIAIVSGVAIGALAAVRRGGFFDFFSLSIALIGISIPAFVVGAVLLIVFCVTWRIFPIGRWGHFSDLVLPGVALSLAPMAYIARLTRVAMLDVISSDFVRTARAKGLSRSMVIWKHCLRNAFLPVLTYLGPATAGTLTGSFVIEKVFNIPGLGSHFVNSILNRDQTLILGIIMVYSVLLLGLNLLVDLAYVFFDPRIVVGAKV